MPGRRFLTGWTVPLLWPRPPTRPSRVSPTPHRCGSSSGGCSPRPAPNWLSSPPTAITASSPTGTEKPWNWRLTIARHAEIENAIRDLKYGVGLNHLPSGRFAANGAWLAVQVMAHNLARWTARIGLGEQTVTTKTLRRRFFALAGRLTRSARRPHPASSPALALGNPVQSRLGPAASHSTPSLTASLQLTQRPLKLASSRSARVPCCVFSRHPAHPSSRRRP